MKYCISNKRSEQTLVMCLKKCEKHQVSNYLELKAAFPEIWSQDIRIKAISRQHLNFEIEILLERDY